MENAFSRFGSYQQKLDLKNDKFEKLVKLSRDITIESKRLIFQLHSGNETDVLQKFVFIKKSKWYYVSRELEGESGYQFQKAYSQGLQEYIEAMAFHYYLKSGDLISLKNVEDDLTFHSKFGEGCEPSEGEVCKKQTKVLIPVGEYFMGVADFSGELMRYCISSIGKNGFEGSEKMCHFLRSLFEKFCNLNGLPRDLVKKVHILRQSLLKVENALYTVKLRGSELPKEYLLFAINDSNSKNSENETYDEDFY